MRRNAVPSVRVVPNAQEHQRSLTVQIQPGADVASIGRLLCTFGVARTLPGLQAEQEKLREELRERQAHFMVCALRFAQVPTEDNRGELDGAAQAVQASYEALSGVAADIRLMEKRKGIPSV